MHFAKPNPVTPCLDADKMERSLAKWLVRRGVTVLMYRFRFIRFILPLHSAPFFFFLFSFFVILLLDTPRDLEALQHLHLQLHQRRRSPSPSRLARRHNKWQSVARGPHPPLLLHLQTTETTLRAWKTTRCTSPPRCSARRKTRRRYDAKELVSSGDVV